MKRQHRVGPGGPRAYWAAMGALTRRAGGFTVRDVADRSGAAAENTVACYVHACVRAGHVEVVGERPSPDAPNQPFKLYAVKVTAKTEAPFEKPDRKGLLGAAHQQMWTAMRALSRFTTRELAVNASTDDVAVSPDTARIFCWKLERAGYLQPLGKAGRWRVLRLRPGMSTGPNVPAIAGDGSVVDRNPRAARRRLP